jgi:ATP-dependent DNA helicase DinG
VSSTFSQQIAADFQPGTPLAEGMPGYVYRQEQVKLAEEIGDAFDGGRVLLAEAETGTGKTLA